MNLYWTVAYVDAGVVDYRGSCRNFALKLILELAVLGEEVCCQRLRHGLDQSKALMDLVNLVKWKQQEMRFKLHNHGILLFEKNVWFSVSFSTVIIGSRGPKISSFMIAESRGTSSNNVGAIFLQCGEKTIHSDQPNTWNQGSIAHTTIRYSEIHSQLQFIALSTEYDLVGNHLVVVHQAPQPLEVFGVHDARQVGRPQRVIPVELAQNFLQRIHLQKENEESSLKAQLKCTNGEP
jgi:hypothetical protein